MENLGQGIDEVFEGVRRVLRHEGGPRAHFGESTFLSQHFLVFIGLELLSLNRNVQTLEARITAMAETQQQQHDTIMAALGTVNTNLVTLNTTGKDLVAEIASLKAQQGNGETVDFSDAEALATGMVTQTAQMITDLPDPGPQATTGDPGTGTSAPNPS